MRIIGLFIMIIMIVIGYCLINTSLKTSLLVSSKDLSKTISKNEILKVKKLIQSNPKYNSDIAFFIDMRIPSGKYRFFVYDLKQNKIIDKGLVAHGIGSATETKELKFSNVNNSLSTSLGRYSIGYSYEGQFGKAYKLYGLDKTNSNAYERNIVLHKFSKVPYEEQDYEICYSYGCPMVNEKFYKRIEKIIDNSKKKIILSIYY